MIINKTNLLVLDHQVSYFPFLSNHKNVISGCLKEGLGDMDDL